MNLDFIFSLIFNIIYLVALVYFAKWIFDLAAAWWLRTQRTGNIIKGFWPDLKYLEITLPGEINKSPEAMEFLFNALNQGLGHEVADLPIKDWFKGKKSFDDLRKKYYSKYYKGSVRMWYSLEIASFEGIIKFYVVTVAKHAEIAKQYIYSQYPNVEIREVEDYLLPFEYKGHKAENPKNLIYVGRYKLSAADYLPIKTYVDYHLGDNEEGQKIDPMTPLLESMAAAGKGEYFFLQFLIRTTINENWKKETEKRIDQIMGIERDKKGGIKKGLEMSQLSPREIHEVEILQKNIEKPGFDVIPRLIYFAEKDKFSMPKGVMPVVNAFKSFNKEGYNKFDFVTATVDSDYPFMDPNGVKTDGTRTYVWKQLKMRIGFYFESGSGYMSISEMPKNYFKKRKEIGAYAGKDFIGDCKKFLFPELQEAGKGGDFVLNTEELATLYHFPGKTFRSEQGKNLATKSEAPYNLPI
jgi:hypothetical protein